jgi:hypothetical protein
MVPTREQWIFVVKHYFRNESDALCQEAFPNDTVPNKTIYRIITKFEDTVCDRKHNRSRIVQNDDTLEDARLSLLHSPSKSSRKLSQQKNMSLGSAHEVVQLLRLRAYRILALHELISNGVCPPPPASRSPGLQIYLQQIYFCRIISKDMSTTGILTPQRTWKRRTQRGQCKHKSKNSSSSSTEYGERSECLHSGGWWVLPAYFMNCISGFIVLYFTYFVLL